MADEDLLIGAGKQEAPQAQGASGIATPADFINVSVFGEFKDTTEHVEQKFAVKVPRGTPEEDVAQFVWVSKVLQNACLRIVGSAGEVNFYPLDRFRRFAMKISSVVGVTL